MAGLRPAGSARHRRPPRRYGSRGLPGREAGVRPGRAAPGPARPAALREPGPGGGAPSARPAAAAPRTRRRAGGRAGAAPPGQGGTRVPRRGLGSVLGTNPGHVPLSCSLSASAFPWQRRAN